MSKFEPKITPLDVSLTRTDLDDWCLRNVNENLRRFKAEFLRRFNSAEMLTSQEIVIDMLPDDPPKATGDDARDVARFRWFNASNAVLMGDDHDCALVLPGERSAHVTWYPSLVEAIDAAMAREQSR